MGSHLSALLAASLADGARCRSKAAFGGLTLEQPADFAPAAAYRQVNDPVGGLPGLMSSLLPPPERKVAPAATLKALLLPYRVLPLALILAPATAALMPVQVFYITLFSA